MKNEYKYILLLIILLPIFNKFFNEFSPYKQDLESINKGIMYKGHILGTDYLGRDILARLSEGIVISLLIVVSVCFLSLFISLILGSLMGYYKSYLDSIFMFFIEMFLSVPSIIFVIIIRVVFGNSLLLLIFALSFTRTLRLTLFVRTEVKKLTNLNYIIMSKMFGANFIHIFKTHIFKNIISTVLVKVSLLIPSIIFSEAFLSFMGIGISLPRATLGNLISTGFINILVNPTQFTISSIILVLITLAFGGIYEDVRN